MGCVRCCVFVAVSTLLLSQFRCYDSVRNKSRHSAESVSPISAFLDGSEDNLLELISRAERELKIFVYPIPKKARRCTMQKIDGRQTGFPPSSGRMREMFQMEQMLPRYLRSIATDDPNEADVFIIDHEWLCLRIGNEEFMRRDVGPGFFKVPFMGETIARQHLKPIFDNVVFNYSYFNRSLGHDHFMTSVMDNGPFCGGAHMQAGISILLIELVLLLLLSSVLI